MAKRIWLGLLVIFIGFQFFRPQRNAITTASPHDDFITRFAPPTDVQRVLETACYDCHSNTTHYPWYANVQPVGWGLASHIDSGKRALNFSEFGSYPLKKQARKLSAIADQVTNHDMPLPSYTWIHRSARLSDAQVGAVSDWCDDLHDKLVGGE